MSGNFIIKEASINEVKRFLANAGGSLNSFRYFESRPLEVIENHIVTIVVSRNDQAIGYGHLDPEKGVTWLGICVAESFLGEGIGKLIMGELLEKAKNLEVAKIFLSVDEDNKTAIKLYQKFGFKMVKRERNVSFMELSL